MTERVQRFRVVGDTLREERHEREETPKREGDVERMGTKTDASQEREPHD